MIVQCPTCRKKYRYDEAKLRNRVMVKFQCPACETVFSVKNPQLAGKVPTVVVSPNPYKREASGATSPTDDADESTLVGGSLGRELEMPNDRRISLAVIRGEEEGKIFPITKPRVTIGRKDADIVIQDLEASRLHAVIEVYRDQIVLRDMNSTNGTYVDEKPVQVAYLQNQAEFRVGNTVLMVIVTPVDEFAEMEP